MAKSSSYFLECFEASAGNISIACKKANVSRMTYHRWYNKYKPFREKIDEIQESLIDLAETSLLKNIKNGRTAEIIFYLKTKGKNRGYIERIENVNTSYNKYEHLTDEELEKKITRMQNIADEGEQ